ncbi:MAG: hypothetical protein J6J93_02135 [Muribaculaceae bacterium]|nr:hypothetical protein [Muribaculaceae bacterium]
MKTTRILMLSAAMLAAVAGVAEETSQGLMLSPQSSEVIPPAPSSAQQVRYQSPQPALATGAVNLSVPLYTLEAEGLAIPFTLSYHTSGIKPTDDPLPCGYGWSLMPGLKVTRTVRGRADELFDYWGDRGGEVSFAENSFAAICSDAAPSGGETGNTAKRIDTEKDIFNISLPSGTYTRILVRNGNTCDFVGGGDDNETVITGTSGLYTITAKDAQGYVYCFGSPYETYRSSATNMADRRTAWALQYIELPSGRRIEFTWTVFDHDYMGMIGGDTGMDSFNPGDYFNPAEDWTHSFGEVMVMNDGQYRDRIHLSKVTFPGGEIELSYTDRKLSTFKVYSSDKSLVSSTSLAYGTSAAEKNLLKSVTLDRDNRYSFDYNPLWDVNARPNYSIDWWGYYNGKSNLTLTPFLRIKSKDKDVNTGYHFRTIGTADRSPDEEKMKAGIIRRITYPTGGYSDFSYEAHRFPPQRMDSYGNISDDTDPVLSFGGGLRVASISTYERSGDPRPHVRRYTYDSVQVAAVPSASTFVKITKGFGIRGENVRPDCYFFRMLYVGYSSDYMANRIGEEALWYRQVTEAYPEGKKVYSFNRTLPSDQEYREWGYNAPYLFMRNVFSKGARLVRTRTYASESGGGYRPVLTEQMFYETVKQQSYVQNGEIANTRVTRYLAQMAYNTLEAPDFINGEYFMFIFSYIDTSGNLIRNVGRIKLTGWFQEDLYGGGDSPYRVDYYTICLQSDRLKSKKVTQHLENGDFTVTDTYSYKPGTSIITFVETKNPAEPKAQTVRITYPSATGTQAERDMLSANMTGVPVKTQKMYGIMGTAIRREFANFGNKVYRPVREWQSRGTTEWLIGSYDYDSYGNLREHTGTDSVTVTYLWGYSSTHPVYSIRGTDYAGVCRANTSEVLLGGSAEKAELTDPSTAGNRCLVTRALWKPLVGIKSLRQPCGLTTGYEYDYAGRLVRSSIEGYGPTESYSYHVGTTGPNYMTRSVYSSATSAEVRETVNYDGLGREKSRLTAAPESGYTAVLAEYDAMDRAFRQWSPVNVEDSHPEASAIAAAAEVMYGTGCAYATTFYEASPMQRVSGQLKAGEAWHNADRRTSVKYYVNTASGDLSCPDCYEAAGASGLIYTGSRRYPAGALTVEKVTDEENHVTMTFTDTWGRKIMVREGIPGDWNDTRYVYNDIGDLLYVIQPASTGTVKKSDCFRYEYDSRGNCIYKSVPGGKATRYRYDSRNRLFAEQDGNLSAESMWLVHHYDRLGRPAFKAYADISDEDLDELCSQAFTVSAPVAGSRLGGSTGGYTRPAQLSSAMPLTELAEAHYYDTYDYVIGIPTEWDFEFGQAPGVVPRASAVGLETAVAAGQQMRLKVYDNAGRVVWEAYGDVSRRPEQEIATLYNYRGETVTQTEDTFFPVAIRQTRTNTYYPSGHLQKTVVTQNGETATIEHHYDGAGRPDTLRLGDKVSRQFSYNASGWLVDGRTTGIRNMTMPTVISQNALPGSGSDVKPIFPLTTEIHEILHYADSVNGSTPRYDGKISARKCGSISTAYVYDSHGRLTSAKTGGGIEHVLATAPNLSASYTYDRNANITSVVEYGVTDIVKRQNKYGLKSELSMTYEGNRLKAMDIEHYGAEYEGRTGVSGNGSVSGFAYDANGNMTADPSRGIVEIEYNRLNLPVSVVTDKCHHQMISYDGFGRKREVLYSQLSESVLHPELGLPVSETLLSRRKYVGPHVFVNDSIEYSAFPGGYFTPEGTAVYYVTDWQGNNIAAVAGDGRRVELVTYYPYGEPVTEPAKMRYLFGGKEREHAGGLNSYDFGARFRAPYGQWTTPDPLSEKFYSISPFSYCGGDPINHVDRDGEFVLPVPVVAALIGGGVNLVTQVSVNLVKGEGFFEAIGNVDVTSVTEAAVTSALLVPGASVLKVIGSIAMDTFDAAVDVKLNGDIKYVGGSGDNNKKTREAAIDFVANILPNFGVKHKSSDFIPSNSLNSEYIGATLSKEEADIVTRIIFSMFDTGLKDGLNYKDQIDAEKEKQRKEEENYDY